MTFQSIHDLRPGDVGFGPIRGWKGWAARLGMMILRDDTRYPHCFIVTEVTQDSVMAVEAMPGGARLVSIEDRWSREYVYVRPSYSDAWWSEYAVHAAHGMIGSPYGYMAFVYLALNRLGTESRIIDWYMHRESADGLPRAPICSQLVDAALTQGGVHLFADGREIHDVTPGDVFYALLIGPSGSLIINPQ